MRKIYIDRDQTLTTKRLAKIIRFYKEKILPELVFNRGYYEGTGQKIMYREYEDETKPNNKIVKNYCKTITESFRGYITGKPITYTAKDDIDIEPLMNILVENDYTNSDSEWLKNALIYGSAPQLIYIDENGNKRFKNLSPEQVIPVYSADLNEELLYCIYFIPIINWDADDYNYRYQIMVYDKDNITTFESDNSFTSLTLTDNPVRHYFNEVPFSIFYLTEDSESIFKCIIGLQDAMNELLSDAINDWESFCDAYMVLKNTTVDEETLQTMKQNRIIELDDDADAFYLTKTSSDAHVQSLIDEINTAIHTIANSPDFSSEEFGAGVSSGIALQFKLVGFNNIASNIEAQFKKAILKRVDLINSILSFTSIESVGVEITFTHNLPSSLSDIVDQITKLRNLVSDETLLSLLPFINDVDAELEKVSEQNDAYSSLYNFNIENVNEEE